MNNVPNTYRVCLFTWDTGGSRAHIKSYHADGPYAYFKSRDGALAHFMRMRLKLRANQFVRLQHKHPHDYEWTTTEEGP